MLSRFNLITIHYYQAELLIQLTDKDLSLTRLAHLQYELGVQVNKTLNRYSNITRDETYKVSENTWDYSCYSLRIKSEDKDSLIEASNEIMDWVDNNPLLSN